MAEPFHLLILGAAGQMTSAAGRLLCAADPGLRVTLADRDRAAAERLAAQLGGARAAVLEFDLFDDARLRRALDGVDFVVNGAGPFHRTADAVMRACIDAGASYMDIDDDVESTLQAIDLDGAARRAGVTLYVGHGASPGLSNVLALDVLRQLDDPHRVEVAWCVGESGGEPLGRAVAEHTVHIGAGEYTGWQGGRRCTRESFSASTVFPLAEPLGDTRLYECAHPEPVMLGFSHPRLRDVICWGGLHPQPLNGALRGIASAVRAGRLSMDAACAFLQETGRAKSGRPSAGGESQGRAGRHALAGMLRQALRGESSLRELAALLSGGWLGRRPRPASGIGARARGMSGGTPVEVVATVSLGGGPDDAGTMAAATGACEAAFFQLARRRGAAPGVAFPEMWAEPQAFYACLDQLTGTRTEVQITRRELRPRP